MRLHRMLVVVALTCAAMVAMSASAGAVEQPTGTLTNAVVQVPSDPEDPESELVDITGPVGFFAVTADWLWATASPNQGPFDCSVDILGSIDDSAGNVTLDEFSLYQGEPGDSVECGGTTDAFDLPYLGEICVEDNGGGDSTLWMRIDFEDIAIPLGDYYGPVWFKVGTSGQVPLPLGGWSVAHVDALLEPFNTSNGPMTIVADFDIFTDIDLSVDLGTGSCS